MIIWYTQPNNSFASFYYFDIATRVLVRIRLELNRGDKGGTKAIYRTNRYYCFGQHGLTALATFSVNNGVVVASNGAALSANPVQGQYVYDFSSANGATVDGPVHHGNAVTLQPILPPGITQAQLVLLAQRAIALQSDINLTDSTATTADLVQAIIRNLH